MLRLQSGGLWVSIHAPPNRKERLRVTKLTRPLGCFNPRPSQPEGATLSAKLEINPLVFQSTPLPTGRSDICFVPLICRCLGFNPRPSQPEGATKGWLR